MSPVLQYEGYKIIRKLGGGNMGMVYLAEREDTGQQVAIKIVSGGQSQDDQEKLTIERAGAELQKRISRADPHHIVAVNRLLYRNGDLIVEMEYVAGANLGELIRNHQALEPKRAARIALELALMLDNLDRIQPSVVHGDLKPSNILIKGDTDVKVVDFGIAKQLANGRGTFNQFQSVPYSSPERLRTGDVDTHSDLWALGVMLYEMSAGAHPFSAPLNMIRMRTLDGRGPDPMPSGCPPPLCNIIGKALSVHLDDRYPSANEMAQDLMRYLDDRPVTASAPDPNATVRTARPAQPPRQSATTPPPPKPFSNPFGDLLRESLHKLRPEVRLIIVGILLFALFLFVHSQYVVGKEGAELHRALESAQMTIDEGWDRYSDLRKSVWVPFLLYGLQDTLKSKLLEEGSWPVLDYRQDQPTASLADWQRSQKDLLRFLQLDPRNKTGKGREQICEGQIARFRSQSHGRWRADPKLVNQAIGHFQQAADLMPDSPDPYLAMAPVYLYYLQDYERGMAMQESAVKRGHAAGKRETCQLADTLKANGKRDYSLALQMNDNSDRKKQHLKDAISAFDSAIEYYGQIPGFASSSQAMREAMQSRDQAQRLLDQL